MSELKPCPFCGLSPRIETGKNDIGKDFYQVKHDCPHLLSEIKTFCRETEAEAISDWNRRAQPDNDKVRPIDANTLSDEISRLQIFLAGESLFTPEIKETVLRTIDEQETINAAQPDNNPLTLVFGRGELAVGTAYKAPDGPSREINIRRLPAPLPITSDTGDKGKYVDELENLLVRMQFENAESAQVLERAVRVVLEGFGQPSNEPLTQAELREMVGEPVWTVGVSHADDGLWSMWDIIEEVGDDGVTFGYSTEHCDWWSYNLRGSDGKLFGCAWLAYRRPPERGEG